jgi:hypothetical protein
MRGRGNNPNRKGPNPLTRSYESTGPDVKVRGTALHVAEKYVALARDAQSSGDRVLAENYLQHAEHYYRIIAAAQAAMQQPISIVRADINEDEDFDDEIDTAVDVRAPGYAPAEAPQPFVDAPPVPERMAGDRQPGDRQPGDRQAGERQPNDRPPYTPREGGRDRDGNRERYDRGDRGERPPYQGDRNFQGDRPPYQGDRPRNFNGSGRPYRQDNRDRNQRFDQPRPAEGEFRDRNDRPERRDQPERQDRGPERQGQDRAADRQNFERPERQDRDRAERPSQERPQQERYERQDRYERGDRPERGDRYEARPEPVEPQDIYEAAAPVAVPPPAPPVAVDELPAFITGAPRADQPEKRRGRPKGSKNVTPRKRAATAEAEAPPGDEPSDD